MKIEIFEWCFAAWTRLKKIRRALAQGRCEIISIDLEVYSIQRYVISEDPRLQNVITQGSECRPEVTLFSILDPLFFDPEFYRFLVPICRSRASILEHFEVQKPHFLIPRSDLRRKVDFQIRLVKHMLFTSRI